MERENEVPHHYLDSVTFGIYEADEVQDISVKEITNSQIFDELMHASSGGLYDSALGPQEHHNMCTTCGLDVVSCPGHVGHISLPVPVYNPLLLSTLFQLLKGTCLNCHKFLMKRSQSTLIQCQVRLLTYGLVSEAEQLSDVFRGLTSDTGENMEQVIVDKLMAHTENVVKDVDDLDDAKNRANVKHVIQSKQNIIKTFLRGSLFTRKVCIHCKSKVQALRKEYNAKIFFPNRPENSQKRTAKKVLEAKLKRQQLMQEGDPESLAVPENPVLDQVKENLQEKYITPVVIQKHMKLLWENESQLLSSVIGAYKNPCKEDSVSGVDVFFLQVISVPPSKFRPLSKMGDMTFENPQTTNLNNILKLAYIVKDYLNEIKDSGKKEKPKKSQNQREKSQNAKQQLEQSWLQLQLAVNTFYDSDLNKLAREKQPGIKQLLEKKQGLFRKHMMGKRVNFAARSVISPDPYIATNEIGIPLVFAKNLTYPQPVTPWNFHELKQAVINGPDVHPGALKVENEDGFTFSLHKRNKTEREAIAKQLLTPAAGNKNPGASKKVYRHLKTGDVLLLNRQPTLHKPSIQAHKARVLPGQRTLRLHYANCKAYNADFDGDEMNAHFPQNEICRAEAYNLISTEYNYLVPKDGTPLAGLIQDHMISGVKITIRGRYFNCADYQQLVFRALSHKQSRISLLPPSIIKPQVLWSGKQIISTLLLNIFPKDKAPLNMDGKSKVSSKNWINGKVRSWKAGGSPLMGDEMTESEVIIRQGELLVGILDKAHYGSTPYGLVHSCYELYGGPVAGEVLTSLSRLFTNFLQWHGFTLGVADILVTRKADHRRRKVMKQGRKTGKEAAAKALNVDDPNDSKRLQQRVEQAQFAKEDGEMKDLDLQMKSETDEIQNKIVGVVMPVGLEALFPENNLQLMVQAGAKGSSVNCMQISCLLGQIELEGRRPPLMMSGQSLPSFLPYDMTPRAGGFVDGRFLTGIRPQEYYFHCMAGREGLIDTAVKTSRSGYLQRCLIKHLEGLVVSYDRTVRDGDGSVVQFQYGEDGLDIMKTQFLNTKQFPFLVNNQKALKTDQGIQQFHQKLADTKDIQLPDRYQCPSTRLSKIVKFFRKQFKKWKNLQPTDGSTVRMSPFLKWCEGRFDSLTQEGIIGKDDSGICRSPASKNACDVWAHLNGGEERCKMEMKYAFLRQEPDPFHCVLKQDRHFGVTTEKFEEIVEKYITEDKDKLIASEEDDLKYGQIESKDLKNLLYLKHLQSLVQPGEAVGLIAAQSIGEPSTQMTLNTFHFAGRGEMNVTLGIPRLREILMVATANLKTPNMEIPLLETPYAKKKAKLLWQKFNRVFLSQLLEDVEISESYLIKSSGKRNKCFKIRFSFLPYKIYKDEYYVNPARILSYMEKHFIARLIDAIKKKRAESTEILHTAKIKRQKVTTTEPSDDDPEGNDIVDDDFHDNDATATKVRNRQDEELEYEGEEEEKEEVMDADEELVSDEDMSPPEGSEEEDEGQDDEQQEKIRRLKKHKAKKRQKQPKPMDPRRLANLQNRLSEVTDYKYDADEELWCEVTCQFPLSKPINLSSVLREEVRKAVVSHTRGIKRCFMVQSKKLGEEGTRLKTEGINLLELYNHQDILAINKLYCNDIHEMARRYGIEAACRVIIKEIRDVFAAYGIEVDYRHLSLVADYMTFEGTYKSFSRGSIESNPSPLQKITFETSVSFLKSATLQGATDTLSSPSSRIVAGRLVKGGTGAFDLVQPL